MFLLGLPPAGAPARVCLIDGGASIGRDTPASALVARLTVVGSTTATIGGHGTVMAGVIAAPRNGFGEVGVAPGHAEVVSIQAIAPGGPGVAENDLVSALDLCVARAVELRIRVINMSFGNLGFGESPAVVAALERARAAGLLLVASAGNQPGQPNGLARQPAVHLSVRGYSEQGRLCGFSARGLGTNLSAPGCIRERRYDNDNDYRDGTSTAAAFTSGAAAALLTYRPDLTADTAATFLLRGARRGELDLATAFRTAGLGELVKRGDRDAPPSPYTPAEQEARAAAFAAREATLRDAPKVRHLSYDRSTRRLRVVLRDPPEDAYVQLDLYRTRSFLTGQSIAKRRTRTRAVNLRAPRSWGQLSITYVDRRGRPYGDTATSCLRTRAIDAREFGGPCQGARP